MAQLAIMAVVAAIEVGQTIYRLLNQPSVKPPAPMKDQFSSSAAGTPIPFGYGMDRLAGQLLWTPGIKYKTKKQSAKGGPSVTTYTYFASFAVGFCEGPARIRRVWFDSKVVYDPSPASSASYPAQNFPLWSSTETYNPGNLVQWGGQVFRAIAISTNQEPPHSYWTTSTYWQLLSDYPPWDPGADYGAGDVVSYGGKLYVALDSSTGISPGSSTVFSYLSPHWRTLESYYPAPTIYPGDESQQPDPLVQASEGAARTPAFRGLCYAVWENFPLANFGNRIPNIRAEIIFGDTNGPTIADSTYLQTLEPNPNPSLVLTSPVQAGDFLIAIARWRNTVPGVPTIDDQLPGVTGAVNSWTAIYAADDKGIWIVPSAAASAGLQVNFHYGGGYFAYNADCYLLRISGQSSYTSASASGTTDPMTVTNGAVTISMRFQTPGSTFNWAAALFIFSDALGHTLRIAPFLSDDGFQLGAPDGTIGVPAGYVAAFANAANSWSQVLATGVPAGSLAAVVLDLCQRAGLASGEIDVTQLNSTNIKPTDVVSGYAIRNQRAAVELIRTLMGAYFFDGCESGGVVKFVPRGFSSALTIPESDLGLLADKAKLKPEQISQEQDLPVRVTVTYENLGKDYEQGKQERSRSVRIVQTKNQKIVDLPIVLVDQQAIQIADKLLYLAWLERDSYVFNLWAAKYLLLDPTDVVQFVYDAITFQGRIIEANTGQGFSSEIHAVGEASETYASSAVPGIAESATPESPEAQAVTFLYLLDLPLLRDGDANPGGTGFYFAMGAASIGWPGAVLERSTDDAVYGKIDESTTPVTFGRAINQLGVPSAPWIVDNTHTLTVKLAFGSLSSATDAEIAAGANALIVGNELIQFKTATLNSDGTYTLSHLYRGLRGTEWACGFWGDFSNGTNPHAIGDLVLDPYSGLARHQDNLALIAVSDYYRAVTNGQSLSAATSQTFTNSGRDLKPYAPKNVGGFLDSSNNWILTWTRRSRFGGADGSTNSPLPIGEDQELYEVEILSGSTVKRTITGLKTTTAVYTVADQTTDFGSPPSSFTINVYQVSAQIGRGFKGHGAVPGGTSPEVLPKVDFGFYVNGS